MPDLSGKWALVTGASNGLGLQLTKEFVRKKAGVIIACRNPGKAERAKDEVRREIPGARLEVLSLELGDLHSVRAFSDEVLARHERLNIIMCNAGLIGVPLGRTKDGFETHMGVNYLGHFALVGRLMPLVKRSPGIRIVTTSSIGEKSARLELDAPWTEKSYRPSAAYADSKLAILMLALSLDGKFRTRGLNALALSAHPGLTKSSLRIEGLKSVKDPWYRLQLRFIERISMPVEQGAYPLLYAATDPGAEGGQYVGLSGMGETRGFPRITKGQGRAYDPELRERLWKWSEALTGVEFLDGDDP